MPANNFQQTVLTNLDQARKERKVTKSPVEQGIDMAAYQRAADDFRLAFSALQRRVLDIDTKVVRYEERLEKMEALIADLCEGVSQFMAELQDTQQDIDEQASIPDDTQY